MIMSKENHPVYKELEKTNGIRHYNFLDSIISTALHVQHYAITEVLIKCNYSYLRLATGIAPLADPDSISVGGDDLLVEHYGLQQSRHITDRISDMSSKRFSAHVQ